MCHFAVKLWQIKAENVVIRLKYLQFIRTQHICCCWRNCDDDENVYALCLQRWKSFGSSTILLKHTYQHCLTIIKSLSMHSLIKGSITNVWNAFWIMVLLACASEIFKWNTCGWAWQWEYDSVQQKLPTSSNI